MKKNYLFGLFALATMLFTASCQEEELVDAMANTDVVSFNVTTEIVGTRAATGEGALATKLYYGVYENVNNAWSLVSAISKTTEPVALPKEGTVVNIRLAKQKKYSVIFWAQSEAENALCTVDWESRKLEINNNANANQESYDAFWGYDEVTLTGALKREKLLVRPFAQLNIGVSDKDYQAAIDASVELQNSAVTVTKVPTAMSLVDGTVSGLTETSAVAYASAAIPTSTDWTFPVSGNKYLALNYVLVGTEQSLIDVDLSYTDKENGSYSSTFTSVPVKRNYRTNIYGNLLTSDADYSVKIEAGINNKDDHNIKVWDGKTTEEPVIVPNQDNQEEVVAEITNGAQLAWIAQMLNGTLSNARTTRNGAEVDYSKMTIKLGANIDLGNEQWTPIGTSEKPFSGKLEGNGYTISNLKIVETEAKEGKAYIGFFGYAKDVTIKNVEFENVNINIECLDIDHSQGHIGAVAGSLEGTSTIENVTVRGDIKVYATQDANGASRVAVVAGGNTYGDVTMKNVKVEANEGSYLKANNNTGALAGQLQGKCVFEECSSNINVTVNKFFAGGIIGIAAGDSEFINCHTTCDVAVVAGREGRHNDEYRVGGIAGGWADGKNKVCTLTGCSYEGNISGTNADGSEAEPLDYAGYVGRGYTLSNCAGSKVVIDGVSYIQAKDNVYGEYVVIDTDNVINVANATDLLNAVNFIEDGMTIKLSNNVTFDKDNYSNNGGWKDGIAYSGDKSFTLDLGGFTVGQDGTLNDYLLWFKNVGSKENTITIKNGTLDAGTTAYCALCTASSHENMLTINTEDLTLINKISNGSTIKNRAGAVLNVKQGTKIIGNDSYLGIENWNSTVNIYDGVEIYMNGASSYNGCLVGVGGNGTINVYGGYGKGVKGGFIAMTSGGTINVSGGEWIANTDGSIGDNSNLYVLTAQSNKYESGFAGPSIINVTGGTFRGGMDAWVLNNIEGEKAELNISGGNFNANPSAHVVAGYESTENAGIFTVGKPQALLALEQAIANGGAVTLTNDVTLLESLKIENTVVLDLNGKTITAPLFSAFEVKAGGELTIKNGKVVAYESTVRAIGGKVIVESGEYTSTGTALDSPATYRYSLDCREGGELIINGGTFKSNNGMINVSSTVTINGGKFENIVEKSVTRHFAYVSAPLIINDGEFYGKANSSAGGCFFCGAAAGGDIQVKGGKFTSLWTSGSVNRIFEVYFGGTINVTGGMFNTNGGIATFVTENTDEATKAAYPYVAK